MTRSRILFAILLVVLGAGYFMRQRACECQELGFDQHRGVGTFVSFSRKPMDPTIQSEVAPARIRARGGEKITWVLRNPSDMDITVWLESVVEPESHDNILHQIFKDTGGPVTIGKNCQIGFLQAELQTGLMREAKVESCDTSRHFHYNFMIRASGGGAGGKDSLRCQFPYDPELVVEREP